MVRVRRRAATRCGWRSRRDPWLLGLGVMLAAAACLPDGERGRLEIEGLAFVAAGPCRIAGAVDCSTTVALLVDRFEVTRGAWLDALRAGAAELALPEVYRADWGEATRRWPASGMQLDQARVYARLRGMRLPTVTEWMRIAAGTRGQSWPWGVVDQQAAANTLDLGLGRPAPVGTFQNGNTFAGVCDMLGNVAEWVDPPLPVYTVWGPVLGSSARAGTVIPTLASGGTRGYLDAWAMGGAFNDHQRPLHVATRDGVRFHARDLDPRHRSSTVGLRCVAPAEAYLWEHAQEFSGRMQRDAVRAVGRSWGLPAVGLLEELARRSGAPAGLRWLLEGARGQ